MSDCTCQISYKFDESTRAMRMEYHPLCAWCKKDPARAARHKAFHAALGEEERITRATLAANRAKRERSKAKYRATATPPTRKHP